jgi:cell division protein FtsB
MMEDVELLKKDIAELQKCFYKVLKRNVELFEKVTKLEEETVDLRRTTTTKSDFSEKMDRD